MALSPAQRIELGLDDPGLPVSAQEFRDPATPQLPATAYAPNLRLILKDGEKATAPKIRQMVNDLLAGNMDRANFALQQLFAANPKVGLETYIELAKFALPQLKAVAVAIDDRSDNPRALTIQQLQQALTGD